MLLLAFSANSESSTRCLLLRCAQVCAFLECCTLCAAGSSMFIQCRLETHLFMAHDLDETSRRGRVDANFSSDANTITHLFLSKEILHSRHMDSSHTHNVYTHTHTLYFTTYIQQCFLSDLQLLINIDAFIFLFLFFVFFLHDKLVSVIKRG